VAEGSYASNEGTCVEQKNQVTVNAEDGGPNTNEHQRADAVPVSGGSASQQLFPLLDCMM
jgi:hypothetical protein